MKRRLLWELRYRREQFSIDAGRAKGRPDPEWLKDCPHLLPGEELYFEAFWTLRTEVASDAQVVSRIPWSACMRYGHLELGWPYPFLRVLWRIITALDNGYAEHMRNEHDKYARRAAAKGKVSTGKGGRTKSMREHTPRT